MCAEAGGGGGFSNCRSVREIYQSRSQLSMVHPGTSVCFCGGYVRYGGRKLKASQIRLRPSSHFPARLEQVFRFIKFQRFQYGTYLLVKLFRVQ